MANNLYYIPLEIGAWVKDTSCVSMESQGCLLNLLFKLWDSPTKGLLSISFSQLAILWRKSPEDCRKIIAEMQESDLLNIEFLPENKVQFESRRMTKEASISLTRSESGKKGGRGNKANTKQTKSKKKANAKQIPDYDSNSNSDSNYNSNSSKGGAGGKFTEAAIRVLEEYKSITGRNIQTDNKTHLSYVVARMKEGHTEEVFTDVIAYKTIEWDSDPKMSKHLVPKTLFGRENFESYLLQVDSAKTKNLSASQIRGKQNGKRIITDAEILNRPEGYNSIVR